MAYNPLFTSEEDVESLTQLTITDASVPTSTELLDFIQQVEARVTERGLATHTAPDIYVDVPTQESVGSEYNWARQSYSRFVYRIRQGQFNFNTASGLIIPLGNIQHPVIAVTTIHKNDEYPDDAPSWDLLVQWNGVVDDSSFMLLKNTENQRRYGYAIFMYNAFPIVGPKRLKMTYTYGYNVDTEILKEWCTYQAAIKTLEARMGTNSVDGLSWAADSGDLGQFVNTQYAERISLMRLRIAEIEIDHFPTDQEERALAVAFG